MVDGNRFPLDRIRDFFLYTIDNIKINNFRLGCFVGNLTQEMSENSDLIKSSSVNFYRNTVELIYDNLVEQKK